MKLDVELGNLGIRVNAVAPGPVETAMAAQVHSADIRASYHDVIPLDRYGCGGNRGRGGVFVQRCRQLYQPTDACG